MPLTGLKCTRCLFNLGEKLEESLSLGFGPRTEALLGAGPVQPKAKQNFRLHSSAGHRLFDIHNSRTKIKLR